MVDDGAHPALDVERIFEVFARHGVQYLLIGGVATRSTGPSGSRTTSISSPLVTVRTSTTWQGALRELGAFLRVGGLDDDEARALPVILDGPALADMEISTWRTDAGDIDVLAFLRNRSGDRVGFADLLDRSQATTVAGVSVRVAGLDDIIESKRFADRPKDREALPELEQLLDEPDT